MVEDKDTEIVKSNVEGQETKADAQFVINSCGHEDTPNSTEGLYDLINKSANKVIHSDNKQWIVENQGANLDSSTIGNITIAIMQEKIWMMGKLQFSSEM